MIKDEIKQEKLHIDEILYSPLIRARDTALHISDITGIPARPDERIREQCFGRYESMPRDSEEFRRDKERFIYDFDGGETMLKLCQRVYNLLDEIRACSDEKTYLLVAHNGISRVVQSYFHDMSNAEFAAFKLKNCEFRRYEFAVFQLKI